MHWDVCFFKIITYFEKKTDVSIVDRIFFVVI